LPMCVCGKEPIIKLINKKPIEATKEELDNNSRSRSAKLRGCRKI
ncbi:MAG: 16S rRNA (cytosine(1402)-N(4))-methyltransferase, partial [Clostridium sp.]